MVCLPVLGVDDAFAALYILLGARTSEAKRCVPGLFSFLEHPLQATADVEPLTPAGDSGASIGLPSV